jgi:hypothetical protein
MEYRLFIDLEVIEILDGLPKRVRNRLLQQYEKIRSFPTNYSDYHEQDSVGRRVEICIFAGWATHYWIDAADGHVKILALEPAGK